jgi:hypothetical protein
MKDRNDEIYDTPLPSEHNVAVVDRRFSDDRGWPSTSASSAERFSEVLLVAGVVHLVLGDCLA